MVKIAVADDSEELCEIIKRTIEASAAESVSVNCYTNPEILKFKIQEGIHYDVYILDIEMPNINGIELAKYIRAIHSEAIIVFLTSHSEYAIVGYDIKIQAAHYILKSQMRKKLPELMQHLQENIFKKNNYYIIQTQVRFIRINCDDIRYIYKDGRNTKIVTGNGTYSERKSLNQIWEELDMPEMVMIERGFIVNIRHIREIANNVITMDTGQTLFISRIKIRDVKQKVNEYWGGRL